MHPAALVLGFAADRLLGDPRRWHPVAGFGSAAERLERMIWQPSRSAGAMYLAVAVGAVVAPTMAADRWLRRRPRARLVLATTVVWICLGGRSLERAAATVAKAV